MTSFLASDVFKPLVSIIIPVYNGQDFIIDSIESALNQSYVNIEVIVINDGSVDDTEKVIEPYLDRIIYFKKENGGVSSALNLGIKMMKGDYFSWLSHDDYYLPDKISVQITHLTKLRDKSVVLFSDYFVLYQVKFFRFKRHIRLNHSLLMKKPIYSLLRAQLNGITLLIPKKVLDVNGWFDETLKCLQDYDYWSRLILDYEFVHLQSAQSVTRIHKNQTTRTNYSQHLSEANLFWVNLIAKIPIHIKVSYEGSVDKFDKNYIKFLKRTSYKEASNHLLSEIKKSRFNH
jgi:glycosyltransferase involved in cell wall biosynthesis